MKKLLFIFLLLLLLQCNEHNEKVDCPDFEFIVEDCPEGKTCIEDIEFLKFACCKWFIEDFWVIQDTNSFLERFDPNDMYWNNGLQDCDDYTLPEIDFSMRTLIVITSDTGGCDPPSYALNLEVDSINKQINITLKIWFRGLCSQLFERAHKFTIPKISKDYTFNYKIEKYECDYKYE